MSESQKGRQFDELNGEEDVQTENKTFQAVFFSHFEQQPQALGNFKGEFSCYLCNVRGNIFVFI